MKKILGYFTMALLTFSFGSMLSPNPAYSNSLDTSSIIIMEK